MIVDIDRRRQRLGWSLATLARKTSIPYYRIYRGSLEPAELHRIDMALKRAEEDLIARLALELA